MSDNITIKKLLDLDETIFTKMSDITLEATVKEARQAYERKVKSGKREGQAFWSQKLVINDGTGAIVVDFIANKAEEAIPGTAIGKRIRVEDAKTDIYKDERRLARGKVKLLNSEKPPQGGSGVLDSKEDEREYWDHRKDKEQRIITKSAVAKSLIEAGLKWSKAVEKEADGWLGWIYNNEPKKGEEQERVKPERMDHLEKGAAIGKPKEGKKLEENTIEKIETVPGTSLDKVVDKDFDRDKLIKRLGKRFAELFVSGKTKGLGLEEWLTKNYQVKSFLGLSNDYLVEIDSVFDDMFEELQKELGGKK